MNPDPSLRIIWIAVILLAIVAAIWIVQQRPPSPPEVVNCWQSKDVRCVPKSQPQPTLSNAEPPEPPLSGPEAPLDPHIYNVLTIAMEFHDNEVRANSRFKGKRLIINGIVDNVSTDFADTPHLRFVTGELNDVDCVFDDARDPRLSELHRGRLVEVDGVCTGMVLGTVFLDRCSVDPVVH